MNIYCVVHQSFSKGYNPSSRLVYVHSILLSTQEAVNRSTHNIFSTSLVDNKAFIVGTGSSIVNINSLLIYDRWGNIVHSYHGLVSEYQGWNGTFNSDFAEIGVYTYIVKLGLDNNEEILKTGNVTLLR